MFLFVIWTYLDRIHVMHHISRWQIHNFHQFWLNGFEMFWTPWTTWQRETRQDPCGLVQDDPKAKMLLLLGEVGGLDEYDLIEAPDFRSERTVMACLCTCIAFFRFLCVLAASIVRGVTLKIEIWISDNFDQFWTRTWLTWSQNAHHVRYCQAKKKGRITKPVIAWCVGTCASCFTTEALHGQNGLISKWFLSVP